MIDDFTKHAISWGEEGTAWLKSIPAIISTYEKKWSIQVLPSFRLTYNYVAPAIRKDGTKVVLKIGFPKDKEFQTEIDALRVFNGNGIGKLLETDKNNAVILIEHIIPGTPLSQLEDDEQATTILASVMKKLWTRPPSQNNFITISEWTKDLFQVRTWYNGTTGPLPEHLINKAQELFTQLIQTQNTPVLTHGDLHQDNVLSSDTYGWVAIDPKGILAEPCFEVAAMIRNPYEKLRNITNLAPLLRNRIHILSNELHFDPQRILNWCFAQTVLSAVWNVDGKNGEKHAIRVAETLDTLTF